MNTDLSDPNLTDFERTVQHILFYGSSGPSIITYLRPDGSSTYKRPDGTSSYERP